MFGGVFIKIGGCKMPTETDFVALTKISRPRQWKTISQSCLLPSGFPVYGANGIIGYYDKYNHETTTLMIGCRGSCGQINIAEGKSWINGNAMSIDDLDPRVDFRYLYHFLKQYRFSKIISGTSQPQITYAGLTKLKVPLPVQSIQRNIALVLDNIQWIIEKSDFQVARLNRLVKSRFVEAA